MTLVANRSSTAEAGEKRRHSRVELVLSGRYMFDGDGERACTSLNISADGIAVNAQELSRNGGKHVIAYFDGIGRVEGTVGRQFARGFVIRLAASPKRQEVLIRKIAAAVRRRHDAGRTDRRQGDDFATLPTRTPMPLEDFANLTSAIRDLLERSGG